MQQEPKLSKTHRVCIAKAAHQIDLFAVDEGNWDVAVVTAHAHRDDLASSHHRMDSSLQHASHQSILPAILIHMRLVYLTNDKCSSKFTSIESLCWAKKRLHFLPMLYQCVSIEKI